MFVSFFPKPKLFFLSAAGWVLVAILVWYFFGDQMQNALGLGVPDDAEQIIGVEVFWSKPLLWFYLYYFVFSAAFAVFWFYYSPHPWRWWSIVGSIIIIFVVYFQVQVNVAVNAWYGPFYDLIQSAMSQPPGTVSEGELWAGTVTFAGIAFLAVTVGTMNYFFVSHWIFRWRTAMNNYFVSYWGRLRTVEGASQRVQEDTMRFSATMEGLGISLVRAVMTLIAFLPVLAGLSERVQELPIIGAIPYSLVVAAIVWSVFGTAFVALIGIKLPGLEFRNQRVEAAYRKELVYGEDDPARAEPLTLAELFTNVRRNYFRLYFHYMYFNLGRIFYLQTDNIYSLVILFPAIAAGRITLGLFSQINNAFNQVSNSFQYLFNAWPTIVELLSVYKRLRAFESQIHGGELSDIEREKDTPRGPVADATPAGE